MDFGKAFSFVFEDEDWIKKIGVGGLMSLIPIVGWYVVLGWGVEITKRVINDEAEILPEWNDFGEYLARGFMVSLIAFVYLLPFLLVQSCSLTPFLFKNANEVVYAITSFVTICFGCFFVFYLIAVFMLLPAAISKYVVSGNFGSAFKLREIFNIVKENLGNYGLVLLGGIVAGAVSTLGVVACGIGVLFTSVYSVAINGHLWGQSYKISSNGVPSSPPEPLPSAD